MFSTKIIPLIFLVVLNDRNFNLFAKTCRITYIQFKPTPAYCICLYTWNEKRLNLLLSVDGRGRYAGHVLYLQQKQL